MYGRSLLWRVLGFMSDSVHRGVFYVVVVLTLTPLEPPNPSLY